MARLRRRSARHRFLSQLARSTANKAPDVFMRNKVFVAVREKRTFRTVSARRTSLPLRVSGPSSPFRPTTRFKPRIRPSFLLFLLPLFTYAYDPANASLCVRPYELCSYSTALRDQGGCRKPTGDILPRLFRRGSLTSPLNLIPVSPLANSYQFFVRLRLARLPARLRGTDGGRKSSQSKVCRHFLNYPAIKTA